MNDLEKKLNIILPKEIKDKIEGLSYSLDHIGMSNSKVVIFDDYILKISNLKPIDYQKKSHHIKHHQKEQSKLTLTSLENMYKEANR